MTFYIKFLIAACAFFIIAESFDVKLFIDNVKKEDKINMQNLLKQSLYKNGKNYWRYAKAYVQRENSSSSSQEGKMVYSVHKDKATGKELDPYSDEKFHMITAIYVFTAVSFPVRKVKADAKTDMKEDRIIFAENDGGSMTEEEVYEKLLVLYGPNLKEAYVLYKNGSPQGKVQPKGKTGLKKGEIKEFLAVMNENGTEDHKYKKVVVKKVDKDHTDLNDTRIIYTADDKEWLRGRELNEKARILYGPNVRRIDGASNGRVTYGGATYEGSGVLKDMEVWVQMEDADEHYGFFVATEE